MRILIWVQHLLGTGHLHRAFALGQALAGRGLDVTVASGGAPGLEPPAGVELVQLPPIQAADPQFSALIDASGRPVDEGFLRRRRERLLALFRELAPAALITEMFPFGRRAFRLELLPLLKLAGRAAIPRIVSVRDVLVAKADPSKAQWMRDLVLRCYDLVLAHTDPRLVPFELTFPFAHDLGERLVETGYLAPPLPAAASGHAPEVLISAGGGRVGQALVEAALAARARVRPDSVRWRLITGAGLPEAMYRSLARDPPRGLCLERHRSDFRQLLSGCLLSVSQAGYNTVVEALAFGRPMVLVPFETESETEQAVRARRLRDRGLAEVIPPGELTPERLAAAIERALAHPPRAPFPVDLGGAGRSADLVHRLVTR